MPSNRYSALIEAIFLRRFRSCDQPFEFGREELIEVAQSAGLTVPKNLGDAIYSFRYRNDLPTAISSTAPANHEWIIEGAGRARYRFRCVRVARIEPRPELLAIKIPDATPEIIRRHAQGDEQALLARVRYNRLIDLFLGITAFSLQNHLRTTVEGVGQIEIDEVYVGVDRTGRQFIVPVQAKGGNDRHGVVQSQQDFACCQQKFPTLICRAVSAQFMDRERIALFELTLQDGEVRVVDERHYQLCPASGISAADLQLYATRAH